MPIWCLACGRWLNGSQAAHWRNCPTNLRLWMRCDPFWIGCASGLPPRPTTGCNLAPSLGLWGIGHSRFPVEGVPACKRGGEREQRPRSAAEIVRTRQRGSEWEPVGLCNTSQMNSHCVSGTVRCDPCRGRGSYWSLTGGVVAWLLNHRLQAFKPPAWGWNSRSVEFGKGSRSAGLGQPVRILGRGCFDGRENFPMATLWGSSW